MATIATVIGNASVLTSVTRTALTGADDILINSGTSQMLVLENTGATTPTINIDGNLAASVNCRGLGAPIDVSGGFNIALAAAGTAGSVKIIPLAAISSYTNDSANRPAVTGGVAAVLAYIIEG